MKGEWVNVKRERERERKRRRHRHTQTDRQTDRLTDRPTDRSTDQPTDRRTDRQTDKHINIPQFFLAIATGPFILPRSKLLFLLLLFSFPGFPKPTAFRGCQVADLTRLQTKSAFIYEAVESLNILNSCGTSKVLLFFLLLLSLGRLCSCLLLLLLFLRLERWERKKETSLPSTTARHNSMTGAKLKQQSSNQSATLDEDRRRHWPRLQDQPFILFQCIWLYVSVFLPTALGLLLLLFFSFLRSNPCPLFGLLLKLLLLLGLQLSSERWLQWLQTKKIKALELRFKIRFGAFSFYSATPLWQSKHLLATMLVFDRASFAASDLKLFRASGKREEKKAHWETLSASHVVSFAHLASPPQPGSPEATTTGNVEFWSEVAKSPAAAPLANPLVRWWYSPRRSPACAAGQKGQIITLFSHGTKLLPVPTLSAPKHFPSRTVTIARIRRFHKWLEWSGLMILIDLRCMKKNMTKPTERKWPRWKKDIKKTSNEASTADTREKNREKYIDPMRSAIEFQRSVSPASKGTNPIDLIAWRVRTANIEHWTYGTSNLTKEIGRSSDILSLQRSINFITQSSEIFLLACLKPLPYWLILNWDWFQWRISISSHDLMISDIILISLGTNEIQRLFMKFVWIQRDPTGRSLTNPSIEATKFVLELQAYLVHLIKHHMLLDGLQRCAIHCHISSSEPKRQKRLSRPLQGT